MKKTFDRKTERLPLVATLALAGWVAAFPAHAGIVKTETHHENAGPAPYTAGSDIPENQGDETMNKFGVSMHANAEPNGLLTLPQALELALMRNPELAAYSHGVLAAEGNVRQSGSLPNPELELEAGEFGGSGERKGYDAAETTVRLSQSLELGGKRGKRRRIAQAEAHLAGWEYEAKRLDVVALVKQAFVDVLLAQEQAALRESLLMLSEQSRQAAAERVKAGKVPLLEETRATVEVAAARIAHARAKRELETARRRLVTLWGETKPQFKKADGDLNEIGNVAPLEKLSALLNEAPEMARWKWEMDLAMASVALAKSARMPDVEVSLGVSRFEADDAYAGVVGVSLPIPLFDRNAGGILAAEHQAARAEYEHRAARVRLSMDLTDAHSRLETAHAEAQAIATEVVPGAQKAFDAAQIGYGEGKFGQWELLDSKRTLAEARIRLLDVLADYHKAAADVERLTGVSANTVRNSK